MKQITMAEMFPELRPEYPICYKTCRKFTNVHPSGAKDFYPVTRHPRCIHIELNSKLIDNVWHSWCKWYE